MAASYLDNEWNIIKRCNKLKLLFVISCCNLEAFASSEMLFDLQFMKWDVSDVGLLEFFTVVVI